MRLKPLVVAIDDDEIFRNAIEAILSRMGLIVKTFSKPSDFLAAAKSLKPDLFLVDINLGEAGDGFAMISELRANIDDIAPVIIISGEESPEVITNALEVGANDFIFKPLDRALLVAKLSQFITSQELTDSKAASLDLPEGSSEATLKFESQITELDEYGIHLASAHLIPKETVIKISSEIFGTIASGVHDLLLTVTATSFNSETHTYGAYAEFDSNATVFQEALRQWLSKKLAK